MKALRFHAAKDLRVEDVAKPDQPGPEGAGTVWIAPEVVNNLGVRTAAVAVGSAGELIELIERPRNAP